MSDYRARKSGSGLSLSLAGYRTHLAYINKDDGRKGCRASQRLKREKGDHPIESASVNYAE